MKKRKTFQTTKSFFFFGKTFVFKSFIDCIYIKVCFEKKKKQCILEYLYFECNEACDR